MQGFMIKKWLCKPAAFYYLFSALFSGILPVYMCPRGGQYAAVTAGY